ncbi:sporulation protein [Halalkalibacter suaedae]|uniref:sporulation protein n=1 Tax=Halalkalibacter suaedae TaxID=2822140 RepID=UPI003AF06339
MERLIKKYLSRLGVGSAKVDLILPKKTYRPGENIKGCLKIIGGTIQQQVSRIDSDLVLINQTKGTEKVVGFKTILSKRQINSTEEHEILFAFKVPPEVPVSSDEISYRFDTKLTFNKGVESMDCDIIKIL